MVRAHILKLLRSPGIDSKGRYDNHICLPDRARICKRLKRPGIDSASLGIDSSAPYKINNFGLRLHRLAESIPGPLKSLKILLVCGLKSNVVRCYQPPPPAMQNDVI
jgi:hypothetical protein